MKRRLVNLVAASSRLRTNSSKIGSIAVQVVDVYDKNGRVMFGAPPAVAARRGIVPYLVLAECENPTATYLYRVKLHRPLHEIRRDASTRRATTSELPMTRVRTRCAR